VTLPPPSPFCKGRILYPALDLTLSLTPLCPHTHSLAGEDLAPRIHTLCGLWGELQSITKASTERQERALWASDWLGPLPLEPAYAEVLGEAGARGLVVQGLELDHWRETESEYRSALGLLETEPLPKWPSLEEDRKEQGMRKLGQAFARIVKGDLAALLYSWRRTALVSGKQAVMKAKVLEERRGLLEEMASQKSEIRSLKGQLRNSRNAAVPALQRLARIFRARLRGDLIEAWRRRAGEAGMEEVQNFRLREREMAAKETELLGTVQGLRAEVMSLQREALDVRDKHRAALSDSRRSAPGIALLRRALHRKAKGEVSLMLSDWLYKAGEGALRTRLKDDRHQALLDHATAEAARLLLSSERAGVVKDQADFFRCRAEEAASQAGELEAELVSSGMFADDFESEATKAKRRKDEEYARWSATQQTTALTKAEAQAQLAHFKARLASDDADAARRHATQLGVAEVTMRSEMERQRVSPPEDEPGRAKSPMRKPEAANKRNIRRKSVSLEAAVAPPAAAEVPAAVQSLEADHRRREILARLGYLLRSLVRGELSSRCALWRGKMESEARRGEIARLQQEWEEEAQTRQLELARLNREIGEQAESRVQLETSLASLEIEARDRAQEAAEAAAETGLRLLRQCLARLVGGELGHRVEVWRGAMRDEAHAQQRRIEAALALESAEGRKQGSAVRRLQLLFTRLTKGSLSERLLWWRGEAQADLAARRHTEEAVRSKATADEVESQKQLHNLALARRERESVAQRKEWERDAGTRRMRQVIRSLVHGEASVRIAIWRDATVKAAFEKHAASADAELDARMRSLVELEDANNQERALNLMGTRLREAIQGSARRAVRSWRSGAEGARWDLWRSHHEEEFRQVEASRQGDARGLGLSLIRKALAGLKGYLPGLCLARWREKQSKAHLLGRVLVTRFYCRMMVPSLAEWRSRVRSSIGAAGERKVAALRAMRLCMARLRRDSARSVAFGCLVRWRGMAELASAGRIPSS